MTEKNNDKVLTKERILSDITEDYNKSLKPKLLVLSLAIVLTVLLLALWISIIMSFDANTFIYLAVMEGIPSLLCVVFSVYAIYEFSVTTHAVKTGSIRITKDWLISAKESGISLGKRYRKYCFQYSKNYRVYVSLDVNQGTASQGDAFYVIASKKFGRVLKIYNSKYYEYNE